VDKFAEGIFETIESQPMRLQEVDGTRGGEKRQVQDPATRAWNFHTALYYKAGGIPWRLIRDADSETCFIGASF
jgi:hypothetical protein